MSRAIGFTRPIKKFLTRYYSFLFSLLVFVLLIFGFFKEAGGLNIVRYGITFLLLGLIVIFLQKVLKKTERSESDSFELSLLLILAVQVSLDIFGQFSYLYPLNYLLIAVLTPFNHLAAGLALAAVLVCLSFIPFLRGGDEGELTGQIIYFLFVTLFLCLGLFIRLERKNKKKVDEKYENLQREVFAPQKPEDHSPRPDLRYLSKEVGKKQEDRSKRRLYEKLFDILDLLKRTIHPHSCVLYLITPEGDSMKIKEIFAPESDNINYGSSIRPGEGIIGWVAKDKKPVMLLEHNRSISGIDYYTRDEGIMSFLSVPVLHGDELLGVLCIDSLEKQAFSEEHKKLLGIVAQQIIDTIESADTRQKAHSQANKYAALVVASNKLSSTIHLEEILQITLDFSKVVIDFEYGAIAIYDEISRACSIKPKGFVGEGTEGFIGKSFYLEEGMVGWVMRTQRKAYCVKDFKDREKKQPIFSPQITIKDVRSILCIPLFHKNKLVGSFTLMSKKKELFTEHEVEIFSILANQIAVSLDNAKMYQKVEEMAITDGLTGLYNHRKFQELLGEELRRTERHPQPLSLLLVDIDHFKRINDKYGHPAGDSILKRLSQVLAESVREIDFTCRYGGEEFALILVNTNGKGAFRMAERIRKAVAKSNFQLENGNGDSVDVTVSTGIATYPDDGRTKQELIEKADQALYHAKQQGRNLSYAYHSLAGEKALSGQMREDGFSF
jgi:two-component system cell cycle response regulator